MRGRAVRSGCVAGSAGNARSAEDRGGCCKLTLEVLDGNAPAKAAYEKFGFASYELDPAVGGALCWQKKLG